MNILCLDPTQLLLLPDGLQIQAETHLSSNIWKSWNHLLFTKKIPEEIGASKGEKISKPLVSIVKDVNY
jgi:hypothetical protein